LLGKISAKPKDNLNATALNEDEDPEREKFFLRNFKLKFPKVHPIITRGLCKFHFMEMVATEGDFVQ